MPTETLPTRTDAQALERVPSGFALAIALHVLAFSALALMAWLSQRNGHHWGEQNPVAGSIQASMVTALPLPPRQRTLDHAVLTSDRPSVAPTPPPPTPPAPKAKADPVKPKAEPPPRPDEILIPRKTELKKIPARPAEREQPTPPKRAPATPPPPTPKATTGETAGIQIPQSVTELRNGTSSITVEERAFGDRYAYYIRLISQKVNQGWQQEQANAAAAASDGRRATITFTIERDGSVADPHVSQRSGSPTLDSAAFRAIQRIDTFGPLPQGDHITIDFSFDFHAN